MSTIVLLLSFSLVAPCEPAEDKPVGAKKQCIKISKGVCCTWYSVEDRFCSPHDDICTALDRAIDSFDALRTAHRWCHSAQCGWLLNKEAYYSHREGKDRHSRALQRIYRAVQRKQFRKAKRLAKRELQRLIRTKQCVKGEPCDDFLEFVIHATKEELKRAAKEWADELGC